MTCSLLAHPSAHGYSLPKMVHIRQSFPRPNVENIEEVVAQQLSHVFQPGSIKPGARIAVTAGSRGIQSIDRITKAAIDFLKSKGAAPLIIPAMGSHGGGTAEGQRKLIEHYGITEAAMGAPIHAEVETVSLGRNREGVEAFFSKAAFECDGVLLLNRVKPHTDYKGEIESGLTKICAIGLGKLDGAREFHGHLFRLGLGGSIRSATAKILETGKILGGLAIVENAYHETAHLIGVRTENLFQDEKEILKVAKNLMGRLPFAEIDVLLVDEMGKNMSGTGMDTNIVGRCIYGFQPGTAWAAGMPAIWRIVVNDISPESEGNAVGMGLADFITERFLSNINYRFTTLNALTGRAPMAAKTPMVYPSSHTALLAAISTAPQKPGGPVLAYIRDTLSLAEMFVSEAALDHFLPDSSVEILSPAAELSFDTDGYILSPYSPKQH